MDIMLLSLTRDYSFRVPVRDLSLCPVCLSLSVCLSLLSLSLSLSLTHSLCRVCTPHDTPTASRERVSLRLSYTGRGIAMKSSDLRMSMKHACIGTQVDRQPPLSDSTLRPPSPPPPPPPPLGQSPPAIPARLYDKSCNNEHLTINEHQEL